MNDPIVDRRVKQIYTPEYDPTEGMRAARRYARWHLGDPDWADSIIDTYLNPTEANKILDAEMEGYDDA